MIVAIVTFQLPQPATLAEITETFRGTAPRYQGLAGLLRKNYWVSDDGLSAGGIYVWESRADAERVYTPEWQQMVRSSPPNSGSARRRLDVLPARLSAMRVWIDNRGHLRDVSLRDAPQDEAAEA